MTSDRIHDVGLGGLRLRTHPDHPGKVAVSLGIGGATGPWDLRSPGGREHLRAYLMHAGSQHCLFGMTPESWERRVDEAIARASAGRLPGDAPAEASAR